MEAVMNAAVLTERRSAPFEKVCQCITGCGTGERKETVRRCSSRAREAVPHVGASKFDFMTSEYPIECIGDSQRGRRQIVRAGVASSHLPVARYAEIRLRVIVSAHRCLAAEIGQHVLISVDIRNNVVI